MRFGVNIEFDYFHYFQPMSQKQSSAVLWKPSGWLRRAAMKQAPWAPCPLTSNDFVVKRNGHNKIQKQRKGVSEIIKFVCSHISLFVQNSELVINSSIAMKWIWAWLVCTENIRLRIFSTVEVFNYANELFIPVNSLVNFKAAFMKMGESLLQELDG